MAGSPGYMRKHLAKPHVACSCGWAGLQHGMHIGSIIRRVREGYLDPGEGIHDEIEMVFDNDLGRWVRISTPVVR